MPCAPLHITKMDFKTVHPLNILSTDFITIYPKSLKMKNKHFFRRAITAALLCICFHSQYLYAQKLNVRLEAPRALMSKPCVLTLVPLKLRFPTIQHFRISATMPMNVSLWMVITLREMLTCIDTIVANSGLTPVTIIALHGGRFQ